MSGEATEDAGRTERGPEVEWLPLHRPSLGPEEERAVVEVLRSGWLTTGPRTREFERAFAESRGVAHAVGVNSCTAALHLALLCLDVGPGDEVVLSPITFASAANVVVHTGARPVFCDVQEDTLNLDPDHLCDVLGARTRAVIAVHFAGHSCDMDEIGAICDVAGVPLIEDAAHAAEASYRGRPTGSLGRAAAFSFYATKNITTGEGGMLVSDDERLAERARVLSLHGMTRDAWKRYSAEAYRHWDVMVPGYKYNMCDLQAALGLAQLAKMQGFLERRRHLVELYDEAFGGLPLRPLRRRPYVQASYHLYPVRVQPEAGLSRDRLVATLGDARIGVGVHFRPVHLHPYYREAFDCRPGLCPVAEKAGGQLLSLPLFPDMRDEDVDRVVAACRAALA